MSGFYLNTLTENASRLGMRIQETFSERTRDLSISRGSGSMYLDASEEKVKNLGKQLDSSSDREKLDAMKRIVAFISKGRNASEYFAQVVKNVASQNFEIRKLVYIYLLRYAEQEPDLALLSINTFQKDLTDPSPLIRAMALRVLSGIRVPMIGNLVVLAIKKCAADISPYVRKAAALAVPKCYELDVAHASALIEIISTLLRDTSPLSIGSVASAFQAVCPSRMDLLHQQYRRLCRTLVDADEWGQINILNMLMRYARTMLPRPSTTIEGERAIEEVDPDLQLLLACSEPLLQSRNPAVVLAVSRVFYHVGPPSASSKLVHPLLRLLNATKEFERTVLAYILILSRTLPNLFSPFHTRFVVRTDDILQVKLDKIKLMLTISNYDNHQAILREFICYSEDMDDQVVTASIRAIGQCAHMIPDCTSQCLTALMTMIEGHNDAVVSNAVLVLKNLIQHQPISSTAVPQPQLAIISHLARRLGDIHHPQAKACVLWLVGQYSATHKDDNAAELSGVVDWAPDVLRKSAKSFSKETTLVKLQVITLGAKLLVLCPTAECIRLLGRYIFSLAKYDANYDVRDRARMLASLLGTMVRDINGDVEGEDRGGVILRPEQARLVLFEGKSGICIDIADSPTDDDAILGTLSAIASKHQHYGVSLPDWLEEGTDATLRDNEEDIKVTAAQQQRLTGASRLTSPAVLTPVPSPRGSPVPIVSAKGPMIDDLDKFYAKDGDEPASSDSVEEQSSEDLSESEDNDTDDSETKNSTDSV